ncbi:acetyltransferase [Candidatus Sumerlaeota bacterium]|nr:acetyltransferase [Candidatus Sumerlaeota bacterium]
MDRRKILVIGAGGHARVIIDCLLESENWQIGAIERKDSDKKEIMGCPVVGSDEDIPSLFKQGFIHAVIGVGSVGDTTIRRRIYTDLKKIGFKMPVIIHPRAIVSKHSRIGEGTVVFPGAIVNPGSRIGCNCIVNSGAIVEHDCVLGDFAHTAPGSRLAGTVTICNDVHVGIGAIVREKITIGEHSLIGAGTVVVKDVEPYSLMIGVPARLLKKLEPVI